MSSVKRMHDLVGTWRLIDWTVTMHNGRITRPFRGKAKGSITYTNEGRMVATLMKVDREQIGTRTLNEATAIERGNAAAGYLSYAGTYQIVGDQVHHQVELSLFPDWVGGVQIRYINWISNGDGTTNLELSDRGSDGDKPSIMRLTWQRVTEDRP